MSGIKLIVGLGNPGKKYENTRHNAGAWLIQVLARKTHSNLKTQNQFQGEHALVNLFGNECHLFVPTTFMNLSGQAVHAIMHYYKIHPSELLVAHDEIDIAVGDIRLKLGGGHGGHNGLHDIIQNIKNNEFYRLRIGVGRPDNRPDVIDYVLQAPSKAERKLMDEAIHRGIDILPYLLQKEGQKAMQILHTKKDNTQD